MANLLYVTEEVLNKLRQHPAYLFWNAIVQNTPIRIVPLEERSFHPRQLKIEENHIYLTIDMKFAYCRDKMFSFMYETQDLSFRLQASEGILRTLDNKQFTAIIGKIAMACSTSDVELVNTDKVYHPFFDSGFFHDFHVGPSTDGKSGLSGRSKGERKRSNDKVAEPEPEDPPSEKATEKLVLGKYNKQLCDETVGFRNTSKKSYKYLAERFNLTPAQVKEICTHYKNLAQAAATTDMTRETLRSVPQDIQDEIVRMKRISKKSYLHIAEKFELPLTTIQDICAQYLKRPRKHRLS